MKRKILLSVLFWAFIQASFAQPSLKKMQGSLNKPLERNTVTFTLNPTISSQASVLFNENTLLNKSSVLPWLSAQLELRQETDELIIKDAIQYSDEIEITQFQQYFKGIKVEHGSVKSSTRKGRLTMMQIEFYSLPDALSIKPALSEETALTKAIAGVGATKYMWEGYNGTDPDYLKPKGELVIVEDIISNNDGNMCLAYKFNIYAEQPLSRSWIYINAQTGKLVYTDRIIKHVNATGSADTRYSGTQTITTDNASGIPATPFRLRQTRNSHNIITLDYDRRVQSGPNDALAVDFLDNNNTWTTAEHSLNYDDAAFDVQHAMQYISDYWKLVHGRNSWNNANGQMLNYVHIRASAGVGYNNAFWSGSAMYYGDGTYYSTDGLGTVANVNGLKPLTSLDVSAHELGHAVCQTTANLTYNRESGAMNEGFSDIWGACVEHYSGLPKQNFLIGEEIATDPLRSMSNPNLYDQPDTYLGLNWYNATVGSCPVPNSNTNDNCGVHTNSGVLNYWFYLLVSGGSGTNDIANAFIVNGIGFTKAEKIAYLTETLLTASANYTACRTASINAATTLYGACSAEVEAVTRAWYAVGVGAAFAPCTPQIGFKDVTLSTSENAGVNTCPATKVVSVKMMVEGGIPTGGNAVATITLSGTATDGQDYTLGTANATFNANSTADQTININIIDDGSIEGPETIVLGFTLAQNGSTATKTNVYPTSTISILDDDVAPELGFTPVSYTFGTYNINAGFASPFRSDSRSSRSQFLFTKAELLSAGVMPNVPINGLVYEVVTKNSTIPFTGFTVSMANSNRTTMNAAFLGTGFTQVFTDAYPTNTGLNTITFDAPFTWDGVDGIVINTCYANGAAGTGNDVVKGYDWSATHPGDYASSYNVSAAAATGCALAVFNISVTKPVTTFIQTIPPSSIETSSSSSRAWQVGSGNDTYFYSTVDGQLIARVSGNNNNLGCVTATVTAAGDGYTDLGSFPGNRSLKEVSITPSLNAATTNYNATIYFTNEELDDIAPLSAYLVRTDAPTDDLMDGGNTVYTLPTIVNGSNFTGFSANFTGFSRFFLIDNAVLLPVKSTVLSAVLKGSEAQLSWASVKEFNNKGFDIMRSYDGSHFEKIAFQATKGNTAGTNNYQFTDRNITAGTTVYYRLRLIDINGNVTFGNTTVLRLKGSGLTFISPNPATTKLFVHFVTVPVQASITIFNTTGQKMYSTTVRNPAGQVQVPITQLAAGTYFMQVSNGVNSEKHTFIKQ